MPRPGPCHLRGLWGRPRTFSILLDDYDVDDAAAGRVPAAASQSADPAVALPDSHCSSRESQPLDRDQHQAHSEIADSAAMSADHEPVQPHP